MNISLPKLKAILKFFCQNTDPKILGKTKLMKLFYFLDFSHVKKYGVSVTGDTYYRLEHGPIPSVIKNLVDSLETESNWSLLYDTIEILKSDDDPKHIIKCKKNFTTKDEDYFSPIELNTLKEVCARFSQYNAKQIVDMAHQEASWRKTQEMGHIPYALAADDPDSQVSKEDIELMQKTL